MTAIEFRNMVQTVGYTLHAAAVNLTRNSDDAKDLVQETLYKAILNQEKFKTGTNLKAWLFTIMRNTFINNYNKLSRKTVLLETTHLLQNLPQQTTQNDSLRTFVSNDIYTAIAKLDDTLSKPFMLYYVGYKYFEISEMLEIPIGTVKNRIHLARKELKQNLHVYRYFSDKIL